MAEETPSEDVPPGVDASRPSPARLYDYYLGGTRNFAVDRALVPPPPRTDPAISYVGVWGAEDPVAADGDGYRGLYRGVGRRL